MLAVLDEIISRGAEPQNIRVVRPHAAGWGCLRPLTERNAASSQMILPSFRLVSRGFRALLVTRGMWGAIWCCQSHHVVFLQVCALAAPPALSKLSEKYKRCDFCRRTTNHLRTIVCRSYSLGDMG